MTFNSQVMMKAIRGLFHDKSNISNNRHTICYDSSAYLAVTISRRHHNPSIPSPSGFPCETCQFLDTMIIFITPLNEQVGVFLMRDLVSHLVVLKLRTGDA